MITLPDGTQYLVSLMDHTGDPGADGFGRIDITNNVQVLEVHDASPISAVITLNAVNGRYMSYAPVIKKWDRIYIQIIDINGATFSQVVMVQNRQKGRKAGKGLQLILTCPHESANLMTRTISRPNLARLKPNGSGYDAMNDALTQINTNAGSSDPLIALIGSPFNITTKIGNDLNQSLANDYIFESERFDQVVQDILTKEGDVIANGGAFQFHYFRFVSKYVYSGNTDLGLVEVQIFPQGYHNVSGNFVSTPTVTIKKNALGSAPSIYRSTDSLLESEKATNLIAIGDKKSGSYPKDYSLFQGQKDQFNAAQLWNSTSTYLTGQRVYVWISAGVQAFYSALSAVPANLYPPSNPLYWSVINFSPTVDYSPLTKQKAQYWINNGAGWANAGVMGHEVSVVDPNVIIQDHYHNRTWVDTVATDPSTLDGLGVLDNSVMPHRVFDGLRVLVAGSGVGTWSGNDPTGLPFTNNIAEYREQFPADPNGAWYVFNAHAWEGLTGSQTDDEVFSFRESLSWTYKACTGVGSYVDGSGVCHIGSRGATWVQGAYTTITIASIGIAAFFSSGNNFDCAHPVKHNSGANVEIGNTVIDSADDVGSNSAVFANFDTNPLGSNTPISPQTRSYFAGMNFAFPFPRNGNGTPYGGVTVGEKIFLRIFDILNMYQDHQGLRTWFGPNVEDFYPIQSFAFFELIQDYMQIPPGGFLNPSGNYKMGVWLADRSDNEVVIQYTHGHNGTPESQDAPIGKVNIYRGIPGSNIFLPVKQVEILNIFDWRSVIRGGIFTMDSFNDSGQYNVITSPGKFMNTSEIKLYLDAFRMTKPLVSTNNTNAGSLPSRNIEPQKIHAPSVISYAQLSNMVKSLQQVYNFEPHVYTVETAGRIFNFGDPYYYTDSEIIDVTTDTFANTEKCVLESAIYTISKGLGGPGGFTASLSLITRLWPS